MPEDLSLFLLIFTGQRHLGFQIIDLKLMPALSSIDGLGRQGSGGSGGG